MPSGKTRLQVPRPGGAHDLDTLGVVVDRRAADRGVRMGQRSLERAAGVGERPGRHLDRPLGQRGEGADARSVVPGLSVDGVTVYETIHALT